MATAHDVATAATTPAAKLEADVIGVASSAPAVSVGLTLASLTPVHRLRRRLGHPAERQPMLIVANACRRLNPRTANRGACGKSLLAPASSRGKSWRLLAGEFSWQS
jgi:hypothetical protein